jgi:hypothetical protein
MKNVEKTHLIQTNSTCTKCTGMPEQNEPDLTRPARSARAQWVLACPRTLLDRAYFLLFYTIKYAGGPPRPGPGLSSARKIRPDLPSGTVMAGLFWAEITRLFFGPTRTWPGPQNAQVYVQGYIWGWLEPFPKRSTPLETLRIKVDENHLPTWVFSKRLKTLDLCAHEETTKTKG